MNSLLTSSRRPGRQVIHDGPLAGRGLPGQAPAAVLPDSPTQLPGEKVVLVPCMDAAYACPIRERVEVLARGDGGHAAQGESPLAAAKDHGADHVGALADEVR